MTVCDCVDLSVLEGGNNRMKMPSIRRQDLGEHKPDHSTPPPLNTGNALAAVKISSVLSF